MPDPSGTQSGAGDRSVAQKVADRLSREILRGQRVAGSRLPSVRALAADYGVNISTVQRALARLAERGLVATRDRSGVEVLDPSVHGGAGLWALMVLDAQAQPDRAMRLLQDALETGTCLAINVLETLVARQDAAAAQALGPANWTPAQRALHFARSGGADVTLVGMSQQAHVEENLAVGAELRADPAAMRAALA